MNISLFLSQKLIPKDSRRISKPVLTISILSVALGVCILILTFAITTGFRNEIRNKVVGFGSHIEISHFDNNQSYESSPIEIDDVLTAAVKQVEGVVKLQAFSTKAGIAKTENDVEGVVFKGVGSDYDSAFFVKNLIKGSFIRLSDSLTSNEIIISETLAQKLHLDTGQRLTAFFVQNPVRQRVFTIKGIYNTGMNIFDKTFIICDIKHIQRLNDWKSGCIGGLEVLIADFDKIDAVNENINNILPYNMQATTIIARNRMIFDWISLFDQNVFILVLLVLIITGVSLISTQLILILEHISTIGLLKALGSTTAAVRNIFLFISLKILGTGLVVGNFIGLSFCFLQQNFHFITLNPENYYVSYVPIEVQWLQIALINAGAVLISFVVLIIPAHFVARRVSAVRALRMD